MFDFLMHLGTVNSTGPSNSCSGTNGGLGVLLSKKIPVFGGVSTVNGGLSIVGLGVSYPGDSQSLNVGKFGMYLRLGICIFLGLYLLSL